MTYISPPTFHSPIYHGTEIIGIKGKARCQILVYAEKKGKNEQVGTAKVPRIGWGTITLDRYLEEGEPY